MNKICNGKTISSCTECDFFYNNPYYFPWAGNGLDFFCNFDPKNKISLLINHPHFPNHIEIQPFCKLPDA